DRLEALADLGRDRALQRHLGAPDRLDDLLGERIALGRHRLGARGVEFIVELGACSVQHAQRRLRDFGTDAVPGEDGDRLLAHAGRVLPSLEVPRGRVFGDSPPWGRTGKIVSWGPRPEFLPGRTGRPAD